MSLLDFFVAKPTHFGLTIGRVSLRGLQVDSKKRVQSAAEVILPDGIFRDGELINKDLFTGGLKQLLAAAKFTTPYVAVCFSEAYAYNREYKLPKLPTEDVYEAISYHVKDLFPFPPEDIYFDWRLIDSTDTEHRVVVVAVQKKVLDPLVEALVSVGLKPLSFEPGGAAISRLLVLKPGQFVIIVEINRNGAYVTLLDEKKPLFTTVVNYTTEDTSETYVKATTQTITEMVTYYSQKGVLPANAPLSLIVTGDAVSQPIIDTIKSTVAYPVSLLATPLNNPAYNKVYSTATSPVLPPHDATTINLLPIPVQVQYDSERVTQFYKTLFIRSCIALGIILATSFISFLAISLKQQQIEARTRAIEDQANSQTGNTQSLLLLNSQANDIVALSPLKTTPRSKLIVLRNILPTSITVSQWDYDDTQLLYTLHGIAERREELLAFKEKLEETGEFDKVTLPLGSLETPVNVRFTMTFISKD